MNAQGHIITGGISLAVVQYTTAFIPGNYVIPWLFAPVAQYLPYGTIPFVLSGAACLVGALLPDIDHPQATMSRKLSINKGAGPLGVLGYIGGIFRAILGGHRGFTHTLVFVALPCVLFPYLPTNYHYLLWAFIVGLSSHLLADMLTEAGIPLLWPITAKRIGLWKQKTYK